MDYLTLTPGEWGALQRIADEEDVRSVQLSRRSSLDQPYEHGFLVVSVVPREGEQFRVAISQAGQTAAWGS